MKRVFIVALAAGVLVTGARTAAAHPGYHYSGGCGFSAVRDGGHGAQTRWSGYMAVAVAATEASTGSPAAVPIDAACDVYINGSLSTTAIAAAGVGAAAAADTWSYYADETASVTVCTYVKVANEEHYDCTNHLPGVPAQQVIDGAASVASEAIWMVKQETDPLLCPILIGIIIGLIIHEIIEELGDQGIVEDSGGDAWVNGTRVWDCPPYSA